VASEVVNGIVTVIGAEVAAGSPAISKASVARCAAGGMAVVARNNEIAVEEDRAPEGMASVTPAACIEPPDVGIVVVVSSSVAGATAKPTVG
jgi:hypothetical protein